MLESIPSYHVSVNSSSYRKLKVLYRQFIYVRESLKKAGMYKTVRRGRVTDEV